MAALFYYHYIPKPEITFVNLTMYVILYYILYIKHYYYYYYYINITLL